MRLVNVNMADGSVVVHHGGVEMGQGLHTKIAQVAANTLGIPLELIRVAGNNSDTIVNAPATAASTGYDLNGGAVEKACRVLRHRLEDFCRDLEQFQAARLHPALAIQLGGLLARDRLQGVVQPRQPQRRRAVQEPALRGPERARIRTAGRSSTSSTPPRPPRWRSTC